MKKFILAAALLATCSLATAQTPRLVNHDGSVFSDLCIAAVQAPRTFMELAADKGQADLQKNELRCNGLSVERFVSKLRSQQEQLRRSYVFKTSDDSAMSKLCLAAVRSEEEYRTARTELFGNNFMAEQEIHCNGMPIRDFARKYRSNNMTASIQ